MFLARSEKTLIEDNFPNLTFLHDDPILQSDFQEDVCFLCDNQNTKNILIGKCLLCDQYMCIVHSDFNENPVLCKRCDKDVNKMKMDNITRSKN